MSLELLQGANLNDVRREMSRFLRTGLQSSAVRQLAEEAEAEPALIFDFVRRTFPYVPDPVGFELFISPHRIAEDYYNGRIRGGDCDDLAMLTAAMIGSVGYESRVMLIALGGLSVDHAVAQVRTPLGWLNLDTVSSLPLGWYLPGWKTYAYPSK